MLNQAMQALGGIGLFLLGMWLMTEGLRLAAGSALERLLATWTRSRLRGLVSGMTITALVQSSSAVTLATLGFVNAGLLDFRRAVWVVFGSNVGTTFTAWLVALVGIKLHVDILAYPLIGIGALLRIFASGVRLQHLGMALAGFGLFFLGIDALGSAFEAIGGQVRFAQGGGNVVLMVLIGVLLTTAMQSSSAAIALVLTALAGGVVGLDDAAAGVIGANIGTTSTALLGTLGATADARRLAFAHVAFNLLTGAVALVMLPFFLLLITQVVGRPEDPALTLAAFHTAFNLLGVLLMWPFEPRLSRWLLTRYRDRQSSGTEPRYLDRNVAAVPQLAERALVLELRGMLLEYPALLAEAASAGRDQAARSAAREQRLDRMGDFLTDLSRSALGEDLSGQLARLWRVQHNLLNIEESLSEIARVLGELEQADADALARGLRDWLEQLAHALREVEREAPPEVHFDQVRDAYEHAKMEVLNAGMSATVSRHLMDEALQGCSHSRRVAEQWFRAWTVLAGLKFPEAADGGTPGTQPESGT
jgi:phosphate:Na+ symporter